MPFSHQTFSSGQVLTEAQLDGMQESIRDHAHGSQSVSSATAALPVGAVMTYPGTPAPDGWLLMDGSTVGKSGSGADVMGDRHEALFTLLQDVLPNSDGGAWSSLDTVVIPDARGRTLVGDIKMGSDAAQQRIASNASSLGDTGGAEEVTLSTDELPSHTHSFHGHAKARKSGFAHPGDQSGTQSTSSTGGGGAHDNMQPWLALNLLIRTGVE